VDKISFTGGPETGQRIQAACAQSLTPLVLELGGKSANIVFEDADLERAVKSAAAAITRMAGQVCHAPTRLLIQDSVYDDFVDRVADVFHSVEVGLPDDPLSEMGPVIGAPACERII